MTAPRAGRQLASLPTNGSFEFDGTTSDIARQLYLRHSAGDSAVQVVPNAVPSTVSARLSAIGVEFATLPGLAQRALLWDSGFAISANNDAVRIRTLGGVSMADLAVSKLEYEGAGCTAANCTQPDGSLSFNNQFCNGTGMLSVAKCVTDAFDDDTEAHLAMWSTGGDPELVPQIRLVQHAWMDDATGVSYIVNAVHTLSETVEPAYGTCATDGYGSLVVPCYSSSSVSSDVDAEMEAPQGSEWVTTWMNQYKSSATTSSAASSSDEGFNKLLVLPIALAVIVVVGIVVFCCNRRRQRRQALQNHEEFIDPAAFETTPAATKHYEPLGSEAEMFDRPTVSTDHASPPQVSPASLPESVESYPSQPEQATNESTDLLNTLVRSPQLAGKRLTAHKLVYQRVLSKGAFGEVWLGRYGDRDVAVKRLLSVKEPSHEDIKDFSSEIQLCASLSHPNIVEFVGVAWGSLSSLVLVLEFLPQGDLQRYLKKNAERLSWARDKIHMAVDIARALEYLHGLSPAIIHRDVKARNVLLSDQLDVKLTDFGVSRTRKERTMTAGVGTPYWIAPEVLEGTRYTERSDIYSFGVLLSELDTCQTPYFDALSPAGKPLKTIQILKEVMSNGLRPTFGKDCPQRIRKAATMCLDGDPTKRPSALELVQLLRG